MFRIKVTILKTLLQPLAILVLNRSMSQDNKLGMYNNMLLSKIAIEYDTSSIDPMVVIPTIGNLINFKRQLSAIQTSYQCGNEHTGSHGYS